MSKIDETVDDFGIERLIFDERIASFDERIASFDERIVTFVHASPMFGLARSRSTAHSPVSTIVRSIRAPRGLRPPDA
jgi:hypothetical protein